MEWIIQENLALYDCVSIAEHLGLVGERVARTHADVIEVTSDNTSVGRTDHEPVTIVIPCYNEQEALPYLANTLKSVEITLSDAGYEPNFTFIDDCSTDDTVDLLGGLFGDMAERQHYPTRRE